MYTKNKTVRVFVLLFFTFLIFACFDGNTPTITEPRTSPPSPAPIIIPLEPTLTPVPPQAPDSALTLTPYILPADTLIPTLVPSPTNTSLPPLPDFGQILSFGSGGGGGGTCMASMYPPPVVYVQHSGMGTHVAGLCVYDIALPIGIPIHITLSSPDGNSILQGDFQTQGSLLADWLGAPEFKGYKGFAENCDATSCRNWGMELWWPSNMPGGVWQVHLLWTGGDISGIFDTSVGANLPELSVQDSLVFTTIRPSKSQSVCHPVAGATGLMLAGRGFPPNAVVYIPIFEQVEGTQYRFINAQVFVADANGVVYGALNGPIQSAKGYVIAGVTDATLPLIATDKGGVVSFGSLGDAADCFIVP